MNKPKLIAQKHITYKNTELTVSIYKTTLFHDIVLSADTKTLQDIKTNNDIESIIIENGILKSPVLIYDTTEELKDIKRTYNKIEELLK